MTWETIEGGPTRNMKTRLLVKRAKAHSHQASALGRPDALCSVATLCESPVQHAGGTAEWVRPGPSVSPLCRPAEDGAKPPWFQLEWATLCEKVSRLSRLVLKF